MSIKQNVQRAKVDYDAVYEVGKQVEYDAFWDNFQENGNRTDYNSAFKGYWWNSNTLRPKYTCKIVGAGGVAMFSKCFFENPVENNSLLLDISHISIDVTEATSCDSMFQDAKIKEVTLIFSDKITTLYNAFTKSGRGGVAGMKINLFVPNPNCDWKNAFSYHRLKELNLLEGTIIGTNNFDVHWATSLPKASIVSIINALSTTTSGLSITLSTVSVNAAFETSAGANDGSTSAEWNALIATKPNWTINLA